MLDPGVLALVVNDPLAPQVLAWWSIAKPKAKAKLELVGSETPGLSATSVLTPVQVLALCRVTNAAVEQIETTIERCELAGMLTTDGRGITDIARKWLANHVAEQIGLSKRNGDRDRERGIVTIACACAIVLVCCASMVAASARDRSCGPDSMPGECR